MGNQKQAFEKVYEKSNPVWSYSEPPKEIIELIESEKVKPCKVLDVGCGEGNYAIYLALKGFDVLGIDLSEKAIEYAKENALKKGVNARFKAIDVKELEKLNEKFDFVLEWALLHCLMPEEREKYVKDIASLLNSKGKYLSVSFNIDSEGPGIGGKGVRFREGHNALGVKICFSSLEELQELFEKHFKLIESKLITVGKAKHLENYFLMEKL
ncbi:MAG: class I SAM-dependent methyltransferase [archaeon]